MNKEKRKQADRLYLLLAALFIAALVTCNLIANKFISIDLGFKTFIISAGILPYPITFLLAASLFVLLIIYLGGSFDSIAGSPVDNDAYNQVFGNSWRVISASMIAYLFAQLIDVRIYHFWKKLTKGKFLWLRNNGSTIISQLVDTTLVVLVLFYGAKPNDELLQFIIDGWMFKALMALLDTPLLYAAVYSIRKYFGIKGHEEI